MVFGRKEFTSGSCEGIFLISSQGALSLPPCLWINFDFIIFIYYWQFSRIHPKTTPTCYLGNIHTYIHTYRNTKVNKTVLYYSHLGREREREWNLWQKKPHIAGGGGLFPCTVLICLFDRLTGQASGAQPGPLNYFLNRTPSCFSPLYLSVFPSAFP